MCYVAVVTLTADGLSAAFYATVETDRKPPVSTLRNGTIAARHAYVATTGYVLDLRFDYNHCAGTVPNPKT